MATRLYLSRRLALLVSNLDQIHKEINLINELLHDMDRELAPTPLGGLTSNQSSVRVPQMPTPLREVANAMEEIDRGRAKTPTTRQSPKPSDPEPGPTRHRRDASDSYFPFEGMGGSHTIPIAHETVTQRKHTALSNSRSEADLRGKQPPSATHPALRPAVEGQSRYPKFKRFVGYKDG